MAVACGDQLLRLNRGQTQNWHSASLLCEVEATLRSIRIRINEIDLFAVAAGPGSFTGLRAGLATVKALAATLDRPVVGVPTLHAVARAAGQARRVWAALPAGRGEVFAQLLGVTAAGEVEEVEDPAHLSPFAVLEKAERWRELKWAICGAPAFAEKIREHARRAGLALRDEAGDEAGDEMRREAEGWILARPVEDLAEQIAALAFGAFRAGRAERADKLSAIYVRPSDAELKEQCRALK